MVSHCVFGASACLVGNILQPDSSLSPQAGITRGCNLSEEESKGQMFCLFVKMSTHIKEGCRLGGKSRRSSFSQGQLGRAVLWDSSLDICVKTGSKGKEKLFSDFYVAQQSFLEMKGCL